MREGQLTFGLEDTSEIQSAAPGEPVFWVKSVAVYSEWNPDALLRKIDLHRGLNVLWAEPGEKGFAGHAAGKTIFCRLIRYLLGDSNFGKDAFRDSLKRRFPEAWLVGEVCVGGIPWLVVRFLGAGRQQDWAVRGATFYSEFDDEDQIPIQQFFLHLEKTTMGPLPSRKLLDGKTEYGWKHLLPWLSRDQEARYAELTRWRSSLSQSDNLGDLSKIDRSNLVRSVMGLLSEEELNALQELQQLIKDQRAAREEIPKLEYAAAQDRMRFIENSGMVGDDAMPGDFFIEQAKVALKQQEAECASIGKALDDDRSREQALQLRSCDQKIAQLTDHLVECRRFRDRCKLQITRLNGRVSEENYGDRIAKLMPADGSCPITEVQGIGCPLEKESNLDEKPKDSLIAARDRARTHIAAGEKELRNLKKQRAKLNAVAKKWQVEHAKRNKQLVNHKLRLRTLETLYHNVVGAMDAAVVMKLDLIRLENEISKLQKLIRDLREQATKAGALFSSGFEHLIKYLLSTKVEARVDLKGRDIKPEIQFHGDLTSAAIETIKILAFDLACLEFGCKGGGFHPRWLLHDSPREADLASHLYRRLFQCAINLQAQQKDREPNFQYIITTTEAPPQSVANAGALLSPVLDATCTERRLLGVDL